MSNHLYQYILHLADNTVILSHRLSEWCGHGPILEQDMAMTNIALDLIGQSRSLYQYAAQCEGQGRSEDDLAYLRDVSAYKNFLLAELPNGHFGDTVMRQFLYDAFYYPYYQALSKSKDATLAAIAVKSLKEVTYHLKWSSEWVIRLGDGTAESHEKIQSAAQEIWTYTHELFMPAEYEIAMQAEGIAPDLQAIKKEWQQTVESVFAQATLQVPDMKYAQKGGKTGIHTEYLGYILAEMQFLQRAYPGNKW